MKLKRLVIIILIAGALIKVGYSSLFSDSDGVTYRTETITRGSIMDVVTANGTLNPVDLVTIGTQVSGQVSKMYVQVNDHVKAGQLLAEIDPSLLINQIKQDQSALETANVGYQQSERDLKRTKMLLAKDYVAQVDLEHAEEAYLQAKNAYDASNTVVERDKVNLGYAKITSPIDGIVISADVTIGQTLASTYQAPSMFKIAGDLSKMKIDVSLSESDISRIKEGMPVSFTVTAFPDKKFTGTVKTVNMSPTTQQGIVMYSVGVIADNTNSILLPGMTAYVSIVISEKPNVLRVSATALRFKPPAKHASSLSSLFGGSAAQANARAFEQGDENAKYIYLLKNDDLVPVKVTTGATDDSYVEISGDGIAEGDKVVTGVKVSRAQ